MIRRRLALAVFTLLSIGASGCQSQSPVAAAPEATAGRSSVVTGNGRKMNGRKMNGRKMNGRSLQGESLEGLDLEGVGEKDVMLGDVEVSDVSLSATRFTGRLGRDTKSTTAQSLTASDFVGTVWEGLLSNGGTIPIRIDAVAPLATPNADLLGYAISYATSDLGWVSYCGEEDDGSPTLAIPMTGRWDYRENVPDGGRYDDNAGKGFTFACRHAAIAKCVELGYRPWAKLHGESLKPFTTACTRMLRADYCGTGVSYTLDNTLIDVDDELGIQLPEEPSWAIEAEWGERGAVCVSAGSADRFNSAGMMPPCYAKISTRDCGVKRDGHTLMVDRYAAPGQERLTGTWTGRASSPGWNRVWLSLRQLGDAVDGWYVSEKGGEGAVSGTVLGRSVELYLTANTKSCRGTLVGEALVEPDGSVLALDVSGSACQTPLTVEVTRE